MARFGLGMILLLAVSASAALAANMGTAFTYQGRLVRSGAPVGSPTAVNCNMTFRLYDSAGGTNQKGASPQGPFAVTVDKGLFTHSVDFGADGINGDARWLEIAVECPGDTGGPTTLSRQELKPAPHALALPGLYTQQRATPNILGGHLVNSVGAGVFGATISGGGSNFTSGEPPDYPNVVNANFGTIGGGRKNTAYGEASTVGGGFSNTANADRATVAGGDNNFAGGIKAAIGGGDNNSANGDLSTVSGGYSNIASGPVSTIGGGSANTASGATSNVGGGNGNTASGYLSSVGGGNGNTASAITSAVGGGLNNMASGDRSTVGGGITNTATGESCTVSGGSNNVASVAKSTVGGGHSNTASNIASTIAGGWENIASSDNSTVSGGNSNTADGFASTIGGGYDNTASGDSSTVPGGEFNAAGGNYSLAAGRRAKVRDATQSFDADGDEGTFVWADTTDADFTSTGPNQFLIRASGGVGIGTNSPAQYGGYTTLHVNNDSPAGGSLLIAGHGTAGVGMMIFDQNGLAFDIVGAPEHIRWKAGTITSSDDAHMVLTSSGQLGVSRTSASHPLHVGTDSTNGNGAHVTAGGTWTNGSDRNTKQNFASINPQSILEKLAAMPVTSWQYIGEADSVTHIGPVAQDFQAAFGLGEDERYITTIDADGVALAAIQGLYQIVQEKDCTIEELKAETVELKARAAAMGALEAKVAALEAMVSKLAAQQSPPSIGRDGAPAVVERNGGGNEKEGNRQ